tara:strand:- start:29 stop:421 length:393 start_codon:yes stop_codon:yes gene_type:complete
MSLAEIKTKAETWIEAFKDQILSPQEDYFDSNGVYWIGASTPDPMPSDGATNETDPSIFAPGMPSWSDFGIVIATELDYAIRVDSIRKLPDCFAFQIVAEISWQGANYDKKSVYHTSWEDGPWVQTGPFA